VRRFALSFAATVRRRERHPSWPGSRFLRVAANEWANPLTSKLVLLPGPAVSSQRGPRCRGDTSQNGHPLCTRRKLFAIAREFIQCRAPYTRDLRDIGGTALPAFNLDGLDAGRSQLRQQVDRVEAGRFLQRVEGRIADLKAALAQGRVAGVFTGAETIDQHIAQTRL